MKKGICCLLAFLFLGHLCIPGVMGTAAQSVPQGQSAKEKRMEAQKAKKAIPQEVFGGSYYDSDGTLVINVVGSEGTLALEKTETYAVPVRYAYVEKSLKELEAAHQALVPYMLEYDIRSLDANDVTNQLDIAVCETSEALEMLIQTFIDMKYVNLILISESDRYQFTVLKHS